MCCYCRAEAKTFLFPMGTFRKKFMAVAQDSMTSNLNMVDVKLDCLSRKMDKLALGQEKILKLMEMHDRGAEPLQKGPDTMKYSGKLVEAQQKSDNCSCRQICQEISEMLSSVSRIYELHSQRIDHLEQLVQAMVQKLEAVTEITATGHIRKSEVITLQRREQEEEDDKRSSAYQKICKASEFLWKNGSDQQKSNDLKEVRTREEGNAILHTKDMQNQREVEKPKSDPLFSGLQSELQTEIHTEKDQGSASKSKPDNNDTCDSCLMTSKVTNTDGVSAAAVDGFQDPTEMEQQALSSSLVVSKKAIEHDTNVGLQKESSTSVCIKASEPSGLASFEKEISFTEAKIRQLVVCKHEYISSGVKTGESFASSKMKDRSMCTEIKTAYCAYGENIKGAGTTLETKHTTSMTKQFQVTNDKVTNVPNKQAAAGREDNDTIQGKTLQECDFKDNMTKEEGQRSGLVMESPNMPNPLKHSKTCPVQLNRYEVGKEKVPDTKPAGPSSESDTHKNAAMNLGGVNCNSPTSAAETLTGNKPSDITIRSTASEERKSENAQAAPFIEIKMHLDRLNSVPALQHEKPRKEGEVKVIDDCPPPPAPFPHHVVSLKSAPPSSFYSINLRQVIGGGRFGHVHKCTEKSSGLKLAAKSIKVRCPKDKELVLHEVQTMNQLNHPNLIQLYDAFEYKNDITLIMEYLEGGELFEKIIDEDYRLTELEVMVFVKQICEGIHYMHQMYVLHLDLKPENILCVSQAGNQVKIIDFGLARRYKPREKLKVSFGTPEFLAPEIVNFDFVSFPSDMWSLGVITYMLLSGLSPFMGEDDTETLNNVLTANWTFDEETFQTVTEEAKDFVSNLLIKEKSGRLSAAQCLRHPWLQNIVETARNNNVLLLSQIQLRKYMMKRLWKKNFIAVAAANRFQKISSSGSLFTMGI